MIKFKKNVPGGTNKNFNDPAIRPELLERARRIVHQAGRAKVEVRNANDTADDTLPNSFPWREYWEERTGLKADGCCHCGRIFRDEKVRVKQMVGGHVVKKSDPLKKEYIFPICRACNVHENTESFDVDDDLLVPAPSELEKQLFLAFRR